jgi:tight adherence protein C
MIAAGGRNPARLLPVVLGAKLLLTVTLPGAALLYGLMSESDSSELVLLLATSLPLGMLGPDWMLRIARGPHIRALRRGLPDALDLLVICTEAGMGLEPALTNVAADLAPSNWPLFNALTKLLDELRVLPDQREAFANFRQHSGTDGVRRL